MLFRVQTQLFKDAGTGPSHSLRLPSGERRIDSKKKKKKTRTVSPTIPFYPHNFLIDSTPNPSYHSTRDPWFHHFSNLAISFFPISSKFPSWWYSALSPKTSPMSFEVLGSPFLSDLFFSGNPSFPISTIIPLVPLTAAKADSRQIFNLFEVGSLNIYHTTSTGKEHSISFLRHAGKPVYSEVQKSSKSLHYSQVSI